jgi:hypothetical protein
MGRQSWIFQVFFDILRLEPADNAIRIGVKNFMRSS